MRGGAEVDLRGFIGRPRELQGLSVEFEVARALSQSPGETLLFTDIPGYAFPVVGNVITGREAVCRALGTDRDGYIRHVLRCYENPLEPVVVERAPCQEERCRLSDLPVLRHFERDGGRYITAGVVIARDEEHGFNASIHRLMVRDDGRLGIRVVPRHLHEYFRRAEEDGRDLEVAIAIGMHPAVFYAAAYSAPLGYSELSLAGALLGRPLEVARCGKVDLLVPARAEFVIEGRMLANERAPEGPFADVTGTYDHVRDEPVIEVLRITHRKRALYQALLPGSVEHRLFMGMPREPGIYRAVSEVAEVSNVCLSDGGCNWLHGVVALRKGRWRIEQVIERAFAYHRSMKHLVVVDEDIDIHDPLALEYAIATRFQADRDAYVYRDAVGSTLDPSGGEDGRTTKVGIDATIPPGRESRYEPARIP